MGLVSDLALEYVKSFISKKADEHEWKKIIEESGQFITSFEKSHEDVYTTLGIVLSEEKMKSLASKIQANDGSELVKELQNGIKAVIKDYDLSYSEENFIISGFVQIVLQWIKENRSEIYTQYLLKDAYDNTEKKLREISIAISKLSELCEKLAENHIRAYSIDQIEEELKENTDNPVLSLDFFAIDDEDFIKRFNESLRNTDDSGQIYIKGRSKEETIYCVLNQIRKVNYNRNVIVVRNKEDWEKLRQRKGNDLMKGGIVIPWFYSQQIDPIAGNITIFVYDAEDATGGKAVLELKPRTKKAISEALEEAGMKSPEAYEIVQETHGLYALLKKRIFTSQFLGKPSWTKINEDWLVVLLMCGQWTDVEGDVKVIEELTEMPYDVLEKRMEELTKGEEPFLVTYSKHGRRYWRIAGFENVWGYIGDRVSVKNDFWKKYSAYVIDALTSENKIRRVINGDDNNPMQTLTNIAASGGIQCTDELKNGMLKTLIFIASYMKDRSGHQSAVDGVIEMILNTIRDRNLWCDISPFFARLCEASPEMTLKKVENEFESPTGFLDFFAGKERKPFLGQSRYIQLIFGLEQFLVQERYASRAVMLFVKLNSLRMEHVYVNSPEETLANVFCPWLNMTAIPQPKKAELLESVVRDYPHCWDIAYSGLPNRKTMISGSFGKPKFRDYADIEMPEQDDVDKTQHEYWDICIRYAKNDDRRWTKLIEEAEEFDEKEIEDFFSALSGEIRKADEATNENDSISELAKAKIKNEIRQIIYKHRFFKSALWAMDEEKLAIYKNAFDGIELMVPEYEYLYLGQAEHSFPLLDPSPMDEEDYHARNRQKMEAELKSGFGSFREKHLNISVFLKACQELGYQSVEIGRRLFTFYSKGSFEEELFVELLCEGAYLRETLGYADSVARKDKKSLLHIINLVEAIIPEEEKVVRYYLIAPIDSDLLDRIDNKSEAFKKIYWSRYNPYVPVTDLETRILEELYSYGTMASLLQFLWSRRALYDVPTIMGFLSRMYKEGLSNPDATSRSILEDLLEIGQDAYLENKNGNQENTATDLDQGKKDGMVDAGQMIDLELASYFRGLIVWERMRCFKGDLEQCPDNYAQIIEELFLKDSKREESRKEADAQKDRSEEQRYKAEMLYSLYCDIKFCPGVNEGKVDGALLGKWVEEFRNELSKSDLMSKFTVSLGKLFAYSPEDPDGYSPAVPVRDMIEKYGDENLENAYVSCIFNQRGVYAISAGRKERKLSERYKSAAKYFSPHWPKTEKIYYRLSDIYENESREERDVAVYGE